MTLTKIINFLLSNWFLLVIAYIVINGVLGRWKSARGGSAGQGPAPSMPPFGGGGSGWPQQGQGTKPSQGQSAASEPRAERQDIRAYEPAAPATERKERMSPERMAAPPQRAKQEPVEEPTGQELAKGMLWAEILGPPRSRRPYRK